MKINILLSTLLIAGYGYGQTGSPPTSYANNPSQAVENANFAWYRGGNVPGGQAGANNILGTRWPSNIWITTNNESTAFFSHNNGLNGLNGSGDGLRIRNSFSGAIPGLGEIDIFTSGTGSNGTEIRFGGSGNIRGANNRFEVWGNYRGLFYNTSTGSGVHKFARSGAVTGFIGTNNFWRIGMQGDPNNINGTRRLEVVDLAPQLRLTNGGNNATSAINTDFFTNPSGNLQIMPTGGRVGVNLTTNPTANLDVNGNARIRNVPASTPDALFVGVRNGGSFSDLSVRRLDFSGDINEVLLGNGTWGTAPGAVTANNGLVVTGGNVQLGAPCSNIFQVISTGFTQDRAVFLSDNSFWMLTGANQTGGVGFGAQPASTGFCGTGNTVEISANLQSAYGNANASGLRLTKLTSASPIIASGTNGVDNSKVLTVDQNGDVVLTDVSTSSGNGFVDCADNTGAANLLTDSKVNLNNNNLYFENNDLLGENHIGVGYICGAVIPAKLSVIQEHPLTIPESTIGISGVNKDIANTPLLNYSGVYGEASGVQNPNLRPTLIGGDFLAINGKNNIGVRASILNPVVGSASNYGILVNVIDENSSVNYGGKIESQGGQSNIGLSVVANKLINAYNPGSNGIGINVGSGGHGLIDIALRATANGNYGSNTTVTCQESYGVIGRAYKAQNNYGVYGEVNSVFPNSFAGYFVGDVHVQGNITATGSITPSDSQFKTNVNDLTNSMDLISQLTPRTFNYNTTAYSDFNFEGDQQMGLIAQEVELVIPTIVTNQIRPAKYDSLGVEISPEISYKGVEYEELITLLIAGIQEQQIDLSAAENHSDSLENVVSDLNTRLTQLENCLSGILPFLCQLNNSTIAPTQEEVQRELAKAIDVQLSDKNNIILNQNVPNPFAEKTVISYSIPESVGKAQIHFYDGKGTLINTVDIVERGSGEINVYANDLSSGVYTYSLVADGQIVSTKRMMKN